MLIFGKLEFFAIIADRLSLLCVNDYMTFETAQSGTSQLNLWCFCVWVAKYDNNDYLQL
jgi:hypothetical protein